ncbi:hypothetical protein GCM10022226_82710 [Sphaerisporangium flaviroseum]|uniref:Uncharacterized protein n=1 Tax=Sphaerisporangium flaviroseum TaxID=509199 RepID=A0ABP7JJL5_9ACTN
MDGLRQASETIGGGDERRLLPGLEPFGVGHRLMCDHPGQYSRKYEEKDREEADECGDTAPYGPEAQPPARRRPIRGTYAFPTEHHYLPNGICRLRRIALSLPIVRKSI